MIGAIPPMPLAIPHTLSMFCRNAFLAGSLCLTLLLTSLAAVAESSGEEERVYTFGVVPQFNAAHTVRIWRPALRQIEEISGLKFRLIGSDSIPAFEKEFSTGQFDFVYMNPYHFIRAERSQGYIPLVSDVGRKLYGILVVRKNSPIQSIQDLEDRVIAFPAPNALGASLIPRADLMNRFGIDIDPRYVRSHSSVYLNVVLGKATAGGGVQKTLEQQPAIVKDSLRVIYRTQEVISHPVAAHPQVPPEVRERVLQALLSLGKTAQGRKVLSGIPIKEIGAVTSADYAPLVDLGLEAFYSED